MPEAHLRQMLLSLERLHVKNYCVKSAARYCGYRIVLNATIMLKKQK